AGRLAEVESGKMPVAAETLIPAYLPRAAVDPFAADFRPLRYRLDTGGPTVWSVGTNGTDEGASTLAGARGRSWDQPDLGYGEAWRIVRLGMASGATSAPAATVPATSSGSK